MISAPRWRKRLWYLPSNLLVDIIYGEKLSSFAQLHLSLLRLEWTYRKKSSAVIKIIIAPFLSPVHRCVWSLKGKRSQRKSYPLQRWAALHRRPGQSHCERNRCKCHCPHPHCTLRSGSNEHRVALSLHSHSPWAPLHPAIRKKRTWQHLCTVEEMSIWSIILLQFIIIALILFDPMNIL